MRTIVLVLSASLVLAAACGGSEKSGTGITQPPPTKVDTAPTLTLAFASPVSNTTVSEVTPLTLVASGGTPPYYSYSIQLDTLTLYSGTSPSYQWQSRSATNVSHTLTGLITDAKGKTARVTQTITVSNFPIVSMVASTDYALYCSDKGWAPNNSAGVSLGMTPATSIDGGKTVSCKVSATDTTNYAIGYPAALASAPTLLAENIFIRNYLFRTTTTGNTTSGAKLADAFMFLIRLDPAPTVTGDVNVPWSYLNVVTSPGGAFDAAAKTSAGYVIVPMVVMKSRPCTTADSSSVSGNFDQVQTWSDSSKHVSTRQIPLVFKVCR